MFKISRMHVEDVPEVAKLEQEIFPDPWSEKAILDSLDQKQTLLLVAYEGRVLVGYVILYYVLEEGEIARIAVKESCRRQGVATRMLREVKLLGQDDGFSKLLLDVRESNQEACAFYQKLGFEQDGVRKKFYTNPVEDAILMSLEIGN